MHKNVLTLLSFALLITLQAQSSLWTVFSEGEPGTKNNFYVDLQDDEDNSSSIPISVLTGKTAGPVFTIIAGVHGVEYSSIVAAHELLQEIDVEQLKGAVIIVPLSNPSAFYGRTPFLNPQDELNLNRVFPGKVDGTITERIAHFITTEIIPVSDVFIDMHGGDANEDLLSFIGYYNNEGQPENTGTIKRLAEASGFGYVVSWPYTLKADQPAKYAFKQAVQDGKVALTIEAGKLGNVQADAVHLIKNGIYNLLAENGNYGSAPKEIVDFVYLNEQDYIKAPEQGLFFSEYSAGDQVEAGATIGVIKDAFGALITTVTTPVAGTILYKIGTPPVNVGETVVCVGYRL
ncbi:MAG: succinylglutamate desuccinylase/aspartoacylase family protein [Bacteroidota bacterium]